MANLRYTSHRPRLDRGERSPLRWSGPGSEGTPSRGRGRFSGRLSARRPVERDAQMPQIVARSLRSSRTVALLLLLGAHSASGARGDDDSVWVEAEGATVRHVTTHHWFPDAVRKEQMSGGAWLSHFPPTSDGADQYD